MATTAPEIVITWGVPNLERQLEDGRVITVHWTVDASDGQHNAGAYGSIGLEPPQGEMIPFKDLTLEVLTDWVKQQLGDQVEVMEQGLIEQLALKREPKTAMGLPWATAVNPAEQA